MFSFLHLGDLHLDSPFANFSAAQAATRRARQYEALERLLSAGVARGAKMVLIAGDCFDTPTPRAEAVARFFGILGAVAIMGISPESVIQGVLITGTAVYGNQVFKQLKKE